MTDSEKILVDLVKAGEAWANSEIGKASLKVFHTREEKEWFDSYTRAKDFVTEKGLL
jgi:hypothetical protein